MSSTDSRYMCSGKRSEQRSNNVQNRSAVFVIDPVVCILVIKLLFPIDSNWIYNINPHFSDFS